MIFADLSTNLHELPRNFHDILQEAVLTRSLLKFRENMGGGDGFRENNGFIEGHFLLHILNYTIFFMKCSHRTRI